MDKQQKYINYRWHNRHWSRHRNQIKRGIDRSEIKADTDPTEIAVVMISMIEGAFMQAKVNKHMTELNIAMSYLERMIRNLKA
ncbi:MULTISPECIES: TetR family transcriptional regulator C-terminal domain-containing protein [Sphingobacterium]|uniref:TetR family transcriptional regulator C-terminal domain-containing protein n=1 Tax=Sphingobacterium TaxID=28453 RepID=UPI00257BA349|nr:MULTISPECIES: hypothetical protein [Sphingobacterium]